MLLFRSDHLFDKKQVFFFFFFIACLLALFIYFFFYFIKKKKKEASFEGKPISRKKAGVLRISGIKYL